jgi:hypothetical protein
MWAPAAGLRRGGEVPCGGVRVVRGYASVAGGAAARLGGGAAQRRASMARGSATRGGSGVRTAVRRVGAGGAEAGAAAGGCAAVAGWGKGGDAAAGRCVPQPALGGRRRDHGRRGGARGPAEARPARGRADWWPRRRQAGQRRDGCSVAPRRK